MIVIKHRNGYYFHKKGKIILFNTPEEANLILNKFLEYAIQRRINETQNPMAIIEVQQILNGFQIIEQDFMEEPKCGTVLFQDLGI